MGDPDELVSLTSDLNDVDFSYCPNCEGKDFDEEEEDEEDDDYEDDDDE